MEVLKIVLLGSERTGKSSIVLRFIRRRFIEEYEPTIEDSYRKQTEVDGTHYMLEFLDSSGNDRFASMYDLYIKNAQGYMLCYDITSLESFNKMTQLHDQIVNVKKTRDVPLVLIGNKCDLEKQRVVTKEQGAELARSFNNCAFYETSTKTSISVHEATIDLVKQILNTTRTPNLES